VLPWGGGPPAAVGPRSAGSAEGNPVRLAGRGAGALSHVRTGRNHRLPAARRPKGDRLYIFPTRYGLFFILVLLGMLIGSVNYYTTTWPFC
jgi:hypothetical protein